MVRAAGRFVAVVLGVLMAVLGPTQPGSADAPTNLVHSYSYDGNHRSATLVLAVRERAPPAVACRPAARTTVDPRLHRMGPRHAAFAEDCSDRDSHPPSATGTSSRAGADGVTLDAASGGTLRPEAASRSAAEDKADGAGSIPGLQDGWQGRTADNGKGWLWQEPGAPGNANSLRVMDPTPRYPNGYTRFYNGEGNGQPLGLDGKPGPNPATHIPRSASGGDWPIPEGW
jgi:hypothetical protein